MNKKKINHLGNIAFGILCLIAPINHLLFNDNWYFTNIYVVCIIAYLIIVSAFIGRILSTHDFQRVAFQAHVSITKNYINLFLNFIQKGLSKTYILFIFFQIIWAIFLVNFLFNNWYAQHPKPNEYEIPKLSLNELLICLIPTFLFIITSVFAIQERIENKLDELLKQKEED